MIILQAGCHGECGIVVNEGQSSKDRCFLGVHWGEYCTVCLVDSLHTLYKGGHGDFDAIAFHIAFIPVQTTVV